MQLTESYLRKIIKEELRKVVLNEGNYKSVQASQLLKLPAYASQSDLSKQPDRMLFIQLDKRSGVDGRGHVITWDAGGMQNFMSITPEDERKLESLSSY